MTTLTEVKVNAPQIYPGRHQTAKRRRRFIPRHAELAAEFRLSRITFARNVTSHTHPPIAGDRGFEQRVDLSNRVEMDPQTVQVVPLKPRVLRDTVDEKLIDRTSQLQERDELALADHLNSPTGVNPVSRQRRQRVRLERQPGAEW